MKNWILCCCIFIFNTAWAVDINAASMAELQTLKGVGPKLAETIYLERQKSSFKSEEDLLERVKGLGKVKLAKLLKQGLKIPASENTAAQVIYPRPVKPVKKMVEIK
ncbi:ComEA family DNA-binding protein [Basilea psittacipulmonis]|uniref:ComEA family DNA-binding protein n=1 Tax=Basilea psittacipulmonis TaxID=1472345 RepID=UPI000691CE99|nr:DUF655 domain-containing protein [Basilea psittacipulmonis]